MPIRVETGEEGVVTVVISNPKRRNALDLEMFEGLAALWPRLANDSSVRAVLMRGDGEEAFCSGADLAANLDRRPEMDDLVDRALLKTGFFPKPIVAAINGACVAGGLELALSADVRIAADDATIGLPEVRWGIVPSGGGAMKLADQIGVARAMDLLLTGRLISGAAAAAIGLISESCPSDMVWMRAQGRARQIARNSAAAVMATKRSALAHRASGYASRETQERALVSEVRLSGDPEAGKAAFLSRSEPVFAAPVPQSIHREELL
jgi:enoyl-CoA hydratase/carnithine racemase